MDWTMVNDKLPRDMQLVITGSDSILGKKVFGAVAYIDGKWWKGDLFSCEVFNVTHWMPLPSPPN